MRVRRAGDGVGWALLLVVSLCVVLAALVVIGVVGMFRG
jgi:hypothetical protein